MSLAAASVLAPFIEYLRPTRSPHLLMIIFGVVALCHTADGFNGKTEWVMMLTPQFLGVIVFTIFAFFGKDAVGDRRVDIEDQLRFSRAFCIVTALMCLTIGAKKVVDYDILFSSIYYSCLIQLIVFSIYTAARLFKEESPSEFNYFQFSIITSVFLIGATYCMIQIISNDNSYMDNYRYVTEGGVESKISYIDLYSIVGIFFYILWATCIKFWVSRIISVVQVSVVD